MIYQKFSEKAPTSSNIFFIENYDFEKGIKVTPPLPPKKPITMTLLYKSDEYQSIGSRNISFQGKI